MTWQRAPTAISLLMAGKLETNQCTCSHNNPNGTSNRARSDEHYKRSPDCPFFELIGQYPPPKKSARAKTARASKVSRLSLQSVATVATGISDHHSVADITANHDDSVMTTASTMTQGGKKTTRAKKAPAAKGRKTKAKKDETVEILEDEPQEMPEPPPQKPTRGRKRVSDAMEDAAATNAEAPAPKKRATRGKANNAADHSVMTLASQDTEMADAPPAKQPAAKKKGQASTKIARKASQSSVRSQASTASLRANTVDDDAEIDRQLQADLERPLTDDEDIAADSDSERHRALPVPKSRTKKAGTRKASAQKEQSKAYEMLDPAPIEPDEAEVEAEFRALEQEMKAKEPETLVVPKKGRKTGTRKVSKQTKKVKEPVLPSDPVDQLMDDVPTIAPASERIPEPPVVSETVREPEVQAEPIEDADMSTGTVVNKTVGRPSLEKRGRGRPKKSASLQGSFIEPEPRRSSGIPVHIEVQLESSRYRESSSAPKGTPAKIIRKPVPVPSAETASVPSPAPTRQSAIPVPTPLRTEKALPPPPPQSATRLPRPPATPRAHATPSASAKQATISPSQSPQSSDAENQPPSSKPTASAMPKRVVLAPVMATPTRGSPSKRNVVAGLQSTTSWTAVDLDNVFSPSQSANKENGVDKLLRKGSELTSPEKRMTVEEWIYHNASLAEQKLRHECETMVTRFEKEGSRAMQVLEDLVVD